MGALGTLPVRLGRRVAPALAGLLAAALWRAPAQAACTDDPLARPARGPEPAWTLLGEAEVPGSSLQVDLGRCAQIGVFGSARMRLEHAPELYRSPPAPARPSELSAEPLLRLGASVDSGRSLGELRLRGLYEHELVSGLSGSSAPPEDGRYPLAEAESRAEPRRAYARISVNDLIMLQLGFDTSHFGLGLVENDGAQDPAPGDASFVDPRGGDRVLEARLATSPLGDFGFSSYVALQRTRPRLMEGEPEALRLLGGARFGVDHVDWLGVQLSTQRAAEEDGAARRHHLGLAGSYAVDFGAQLLLLEAELAREWGREAWPSGAEVVARGAALRATLSASRLTVGLTALVATGDEEPASGARTTFRADPNFDQGLLLMRRVLAVASAGEALTTAPRATGGGASGAFTLFPRVGYRLTTGLDAYAGVLFAFATKEPVDASAAPPRGPFGAAPGRYLGTEYDVGARFRVLAWGSLLTLGAEAGLLDPGSALAGSPAAPGAGELMLAARGFVNLDL